MAAFAAIAMRFAGELVAMDILVAVETEFVPDTIHRFGAGRQMALGTGHGRMFANQNIRTLLMPAHIEGRRLVTLLRVACPAVFLELACMRIVFAMAIRANRVRHRLFEVRRAMTHEAIHLRVLALQRKPGAAMVEGTGHVDPLPSIGHVAVLTLAWKGTLVRVAMTIVAACKRNVTELRRNFAGNIGAQWLVALRTGQSGVAASELVACRLVIETRGGLPPLHRFVAGGAVFAQLPAMLVGMAAGTLLCQAQIRPV
jgi:hypothetical protein